jgi:hypothetical protein
LPASSTSLWYNNGKRRVVSGRSLSKLVATPIGGLAERFAG